jgi:glycerophosphoryl diester phosphodiesterase
MRSPILPVIATSLLLAACASAPPQPEPASAANAGPAVLVIAHRGASGYRPEHTLAAYRLAIEMGADFIEPDLVPTADGVLIARHENELGESTDVGARPEFAHRRATKSIDGRDVTGWFSEDFTLAEIRTLRARESNPEARPGNAAYDGQFGIPTFAEVLALAAAASRPVGVYPETKHPTYFLSEGRRLDGSPIAIDTSQLLVDQLVASSFTDPARVYIQSFEIQNLIELKHRILPAAGIDVPLVQLFGDLHARVLPPNGAFSVPWDVYVNTRAGADLAAIYGPLHAVVPGGLGPATTYRELAAPAALAAMRAHYASGLGPWLASLLEREPLPAGSAAPARLTGREHPLLADAHAAGLAVHVYTLRAEPRFRVLDRDGTLLSMQDEIALALDAGATGFFTDHADLGVAARDAWGGAR